LPFAVRELLVEHLKNHTACFSYASGQTHLFDPFTAEVLSILTEQAPHGDLATVSQGLAARLDANVAELERPTLDAIEVLLDLGLIEASDAA
jgi:hypothetical protein